MRRHVLPTALFETNKKWVILLGRNCIRIPGYKEIVLTRHQRPHTWWLAFWFVFFFFFFSIFQYCSSEFSKFQARQSELCCCSLLVSVFSGLSRFRKLNRSVKVRVRDLYSQTRPWFSKSKYKQSAVWLFLSPDLHCRSDSLRLRLLLVWLANTNTGRRGADIEWQKIGK